MPSSPPRARPRLVAFVLAAIAGSGCLTDAHGQPSALEVTSDTDVVVAGQPATVTWHFSPDATFKIASVDTLALANADFVSSRYGAESVPVRHTRAESVLVVPSSPGTVEIPSRTVVLERLRDGAAITLTSPTKTITVLPTPKGGPLVTASWVTMKCEVGRLADGTRVRTVTITADGDLRRGESPVVVGSPGAPSRATRVHEPYLRSEPDELRNLSEGSWQFRIDSDGTTPVVLPPVEFRHYDPKAGFPRVARCDAQVLLPERGEASVPRAVAPVEPAVRDGAELASTGYWALPAILLASSIGLVTLPARKRRAATAQRSIGELRGELARLIDESGCDARSLETDGGEIGNRFRALTALLAQRQDDQPLDESTLAAWERLVEALRRSWR